MSTEFPDNKTKDIIDMQAIADRAALALNYETGNVVALHIVSEALYTIKTIPSGIHSEVFTASFAVTQKVEKGLLGISHVHRVSDIGLLNPEISIAEHIEVVVNMNPGVGIVLDRETAVKLGKDETRKLALIDYGDNHCLLTGLNSRGIDVYLTPDVKSVSDLGSGFSVTSFEQT